MHEISQTRDVPNEITPFRDFLSAVTLCFMKHCALPHPEMFSHITVGEGSLSPARGSTPLPHSARLG